MRRRSNTWWDTGERTGSSGTSLQTERESVSAAHLICIIVNAKLSNKELYSPSITSTRDQTYSNR